MVSTKDCNALRVPHLKCNQKRYSLNRVIATINIIPHKQIICIWTLSTNPEKFHKIMELPMNITTNCHRASN
uniref:PP2Ac-4-Phosphatase 2A isoform 4 belonging to family 2 n=1 Tax=Arundo donax TaxID=35708 RepID=A0A0A9E2L4_ARUDO